MAYCHGSPVMLRIPSILFYHTFQNYHSWFLENKKFFGTFPA
ncbi:hypothetical protein HMPREF1985_02036 [Mitsuokella sp. oral taxon 131 str. W9106]|nr:hypothetical protein HMPREF1985_02036 [Mitsuokella sp. oral taxon 131 str. W9106]